jgi:hypothetical protein
VKRIVAILFSLALLLAGLPAGMASACAPGAATKPCCHCEGKMACCAVKDSAPTEQTPAVPAAALEQHDCQAVLGQLAGENFLPSVSVPTGKSFCRVAPSASAVALFKRDCTFLI